MINITKPFRIYLLVAFTVIIVLAACQNPAIAPVASLESDEPVFTEMSSISEGTTIKEGILEYSAGHYLEGEPLVLGFDPYGYNYQAHIFKGSYVNAYLGRDGFPPYEGDDETYLTDNPEVENHWAWEFNEMERCMAQQRGSRRRRQA